MRPRHLILCLCLISGWAAAADRPNLVVVLADDLSYGTLAHEGGGIAPTPNLDRMAAEGLRFINCHVQPVCTPTRAQLMTGRGNRRNYVGFGDLPHEPTFANHLRDLGYATAMAGKWQLGNKTTRPREAGFDTFHLREQQYAEIWNRYWGGAFWVDGVRVEIDNDRYAPDVQLAWALDWVDRQTADRPFLLYLPTPLIHDAYISSPQRWTAGEPVPGHETAHGKKVLDEMLTQLDVQMGVLMDHLQRRNLAENTIVLFLGDNGGSAPVPQAEGKPLPKGKGTTLNLGTHVSCIARWPGRIQAGVAEDLVCATDILPTLIDLAGGTIPAEPVLDGVSLAPRLLQGTPSPRTSIYHWWWRPQRTEVWVHDARWKLYQDGRFVDVVADPLEEAPLAEVSGEALEARQRLQGELDRHARIPEPRIPGTGKAEDDDE